MEGEILNRGRILQQDLAAPWAEGEIEVTARIPGHIENKGEMVLTDVFGKSNISRIGGKLTMHESPEFREKLRRAAGIEDPTPTPPAESPPPPPEKSGVQEALDRLEMILPRLSFLLVLACVFFAVRAGIASSRQEKRGGGAAVSAEEEHFRRSQRLRLEQLDEWLRSGLIDRKEYAELKRRYREDRRPEERGDR